MSLQFATQKLEYSAEDGHLKQSDIGQIIFNNRSERDLMAQAALARLIKVNNLNTGSHFGGKIKNCIDLKTSSKQNKLQQIKTNNQNHISQSIKTNQQAIERLEKDLEKEMPDTQKRAQMKHRLEHLQEEQISLSTLSESLKRSEQILGFIGDSYDTLVEFDGGDTGSFGAHGYAIIKNNDSGEINLKPVETTQLNESRQVEAGISNGMASLFRKESKQSYDRNEGIQKLIEANSPIKPNTFNFGKALFGHKKTQSTGAEAAGAACCSITSLDELANVGQRTDHDHGEIILPANGGEAALTGFVTYASAAGIKIATDIYKNFNHITNNIKTAEKTLELVKAENKAVIDQPKFYEKKQAIQACETFLRHQKSEAKFQKRIAGVLSGIGSLSILVGQFVAKISPIGLYLLSAFGASHVIHMGKELKRACKDFKASQPKTAEKHHFYKKIKNLSLSFASWSAYTAGTATLGTMSLGMMGFTIKTGIAPALIIAGIAALGVGIAGTLVYNNIMTSKRFFPGLPMLGRLDVRNPPTKTETEQSLKQAQALRQLIKGYRGATFKYLRHHKPLAVMKNTALRYANKAGLYTTLGLVPKPFMENKFNIKGRHTRAVGHTHSTQNINRLDTLRGLFEIEKIKNPELKKSLTHSSSTDTFELDKFNTSKKALETLMHIEKQTPIDFMSIDSKISKLQDLKIQKNTEFKADRNNHIQSLHHLLDLMENTPKSDQMMKFFSKKVLKQRSQLQSKLGSKQHHGLLGQFMPEYKKSTWIKPQYESLFRNSAPAATSINEPQKYPTLASDHLEILSYEKLDGKLLKTLGGLYKTMPCCPANKFANDPETGILNEFRKAFHSQSHHSIDDIKKLESLLYECVDQYLLYQARNNAKEDIALHANYLRAFDPLDKNSAHVALALN